MHAGKVLYTSYAGRHGARYKKNFISLKTVLIFQTSMLATLGKWATTHGRGFFLGKKCSWTLLPGSTWLQTPITHLYHWEQRSKLQNTFCSLKTWWLKRFIEALWYLSTTRQATWYFKTMLKILVDRALMLHISFQYPSVRMVSALTLDGFTCCVSRHNNLCKNLFPDFALYAICCFNNKLLIDTLVLEESKKTEREKKLANLISGRCHDTTNSILVGSAPYPLAVTKQ